MLPYSKRCQRLGVIDITKDFDAVLTVLLDENFDATAIYKATRADAIPALTTPGSKARTERGALGGPKFRPIGRLRWKRND